MKVPLSWLREFVDVPGSAEEIGAQMSVRGLALEGIERAGDDAVIDFDVTANRPDCLSVTGIAREIATAYGLPLHARAKARALTVAHRLGGGLSSSDDVSMSRAPALAGALEIPVSILDPDLCSRYVAAVADVNVAPSPAWMQTRLLACGVRPINNIVDVTNYVLLERGYPMHAFDHAKLAGPAIVVRRARGGERITTLDGKGRALDKDMLVIADAERAQAIGGVMGGAASEVSATTTRIVLEAAWFKPQSVRTTSRRLGLRTEASYRFERGADLTGTSDAMARALELLQVIDAGRPAGAIVDCYPVPASTRELTLDTPLIRRFLGMDVPDVETVRILESLGFTVRTLGSWHVSAPEAPTTFAQPGHGWQLQVPGWRVDISRPVDVVEEVGRHYGFEHLPDTFPAVEAAPLPSDARIPRDARIRRALLAMGISEAITFAFIEDAAAAPFLNGESAVAIANPLSEKFTTLRPSLLPGLIDVVSHNRRHGTRDVRVFEIGTRFSPRGETRAAAVAWTGVAASEHWSGGRRDVDFFDLKGVAEQLGAVMRVAAELVPAVSPYLVEGRAAEWRAGERVIAVLGQAVPAIVAARDLPPADPVYVLEVDVDALTAAAPASATFAKPLPRHPSIARDIAILLDDTLSAETVRDTIRAAGPNTLVGVREFDRYQGKGIAEGKVSLALHLTFQAPDRTLTDGEVATAMQEIVAALTSKLGATQR
jgi:phenylalanyl-tRNA synthetase beta chain